jgi:lactoylglutathione lyase
LKAKRTSLTDDFRVNTLSSDAISSGNVRQVVPFLHVSSMESSLRFYMDGLGFSMKNRWLVDGKVRWCWLMLGGAALMLQEFSEDGHHSSRTSGKVGDGISIAFICEDAIAFYREVRGRGVDASEPEVGNAMWVTELSDPDGFHLFFESYTDTPEETKLSEVSNRS